MPYVPIEWLAEHVELPENLTAAQLSASLVKVGLEEEQIIPAKVSGDLVVGKVLEVTRTVQKNGKTIAYARVDVGSFNDEPGTGAEPSELASRGIICGAPNLDVDQHVIVALPGTVLPGDFEIAARKTYGHISDGMICSEVELGIGDDASGIVVLDTYLDKVPPVGTNLLSLLGLGTELLEINITPDRGYAFSMRGVAREYSHSTGAAFTDPFDEVKVNSTDGGFPVTVDDTNPIHGQVGCDRFVTRTVRGVDPLAPSPEWMRRRLSEAGMRPISLAVDITNYVMLDLGQPLHAYDLGQMRDGIVVRRAKPGEKLTTLDDVERTLSPEDLMITDDGGARVVGLAGVMGGASTEITEETTDVLVEAAHFDPVTIARTARRHKLPSEASKRFERGVDPELPPVAAQRVVDLLVEYGGGVADLEGTDLNTTVAPAQITMELSLPARLVGVEYTTDEIVETLSEIGCDVTVNGHAVVVLPPSWRPDLQRGVDLVEEIARLRGYDAIPSVVPTAPAGQGLTPRQAKQRIVMRTFAEHGLNEVLSYPFVGDIYDLLGVPADDPRRAMVRLANPLQDDAPYMRSTILASLIEVARRNVARGNDLKIMEAGRVTQPTKPLSETSLPPVAQRPSDEVLDAIFTAVPPQPFHVAAIVAGTLSAGGPLGTERPVDWADAIEWARILAAAIGADVTVQQAEYAPWHPGRCAAILSDGELLGYAGELHPSVLRHADLPERTVAFELNLEPLLGADSEPLAVSRVRTFPPAKEDIALVMDVSIPASRALDVVRQAAGQWAEDVHLFDDYRSEALGDKKSLAFAIRLRADHTLTAEEIASVRNTVVKAAEVELGAHLR